MAFPPDLVRTADAANAALGRAHLAMLEALAALAPHDGWEDDGAADLPHWVSMRYGVSWWRSKRWVDAAVRLPELPRSVAALASGRLPLETFVELARFVTTRDEERWLRWARGVSPGTVRRRADREIRRSREETEAQARERYLAWWPTDEGRRLAFEGELPATEGAALVRAIERRAGRVPAMPGEDGPQGVAARRADALVELASGSLATDPDPERATVVVHVDADRTGAAEIEGGGIVDAPALERLLCDARIELVVEDAVGDPVAHGRARREPSPWIARQVRRRDRECRFPGCGRRSFTQVHHVTWWSRGGPTEAANLVLLCGFHHRLVHDHGWGLERRADGEVRWYRPGGTPYREGPTRTVDPAPPAALLAVG